MLETTGLGAELVDGAAAGAELGGASVGDGEPGEPDLPVARDEGDLRGDFEGAGAAEELGAGWPGWALGCTPADRALLWCR